MRPVDRSRRSLWALEHFGFLGLFAGMDSPASATITRELLGWDPTGPSLIDDLDKDYYYSGARR